MTIFPSWLKHDTDRVQDDVERITIAFDIIDESGYNIDVRDDMKSHWIEFMIPEYRIDDDKVETRRLALMCLIHHNIIDINKSAYEFCDYVVTEGLSQ